MSLKFGIDLGTTNSSIAYATDPNHVKIMQFHVGTEAPPYSASMVSSKVFIREDRGGKIDLQVGYKAQKAFRKFSFTVAKLIERLKLTVEDEPSWSTQIGSTKYEASEIFAKVLEVLRRQAENDIKADSLNADGVVIGVPVDFKDSSKIIYLDALVKAGFYKNRYEANKKTEFVSEPLAVAVTNGIDLHSDKNVMVFDFGGGTLDVTIVNLKEQINRQVKLHPHEVKAKRRITCGGEKLTHLFFTRCFCNNSKYGVSELADAFDFPRNLSPDALWEKMLETSDGQQFCEEVEKLKCQLSVRESVNFTFMGDDGVIVDDCMFTRQEFESSISEELEKMTCLIDQCLKDASTPASRIDEVILAGGSALIPCVQQLLIQRFGQAKVKVKNSLNQADENEVLTSVVRGLAILGGSSTMIDDIVDKDYGIIWQTADGQSDFDVVIPRNTRVAETITSPSQGIGPHRGPYGTTRNLPERLHVVVGERTQGSATPIYDTVFNVNPHSKQYTIYMSVDPKTGMLKVSVYDEDLHQSVSSFNAPINTKKER